ncbi:MAG: hypothetical protein HOP11_10175 [Saprospiraceae bacterium]|nr:hypothetical protein [Saprospiraceae bacterium]
MRIGFIGIVIFSLLSCYSFKGISIDPELSTFFVENVEDITGSAPPNYAAEFGYALSNKIRRDTRLSVKNTNADLQFKCSVTRFSVESVAPVAGQSNAINRVTIGIKIQCTNLLNEKGNWTKDFSKFEDFSANQNFNDVQTTLLSNLNKLILEDIFNAAFSNW